MNGQYRNIFEEIGISGEETAERLREITHTFFYGREECVYHPVGKEMEYFATAQGKPQIL